MKNMKFILAVVLTATLCAFSFASRADDSTNAPAKTYPLKTCLVCGMELGMMDSKPYMFVYKGQEIKLCDKSVVGSFAFSGRFAAFPLALRGFGMKLRDAGIKNLIFVF